MTLPIKLDLPDSFFASESRSGFTITEKMKKVWAVELDLLVEFDAFCKEAGIQYFLDSGTLLGAIREKGFIPWDDDIDVVLLRDEYDKLLEKAKDGFKYPYFFQTSETDTNYLRGHAQLRNSMTTGIIPSEGRVAKFNQGIFIDIFVFDGLSEDKKVLQQQINRIKWIKKIYRTRWLPYSDNYFKNAVKVALSKILSIWLDDSKKLSIKMDEIMKENGDSEHIGKLTLMNNVNNYHRLKKEWFKQNVLVDFEGKIFPVPQNYVDVLKEYYGADYMQPRMESSMHGELILDPEVDYKKSVISLKNKQ